MSRDRRWTRIVLPALLSTLLWSAAEAQDRPAASGPDAEQAPEASPAPERADLSAANELLREAKYEEAELLLAELAESFPDDPALLLMRGEVLLAIGRAADALTVLEHGVEIEAERPRIHFQLASARAATGDVEGAVAAYGRELELNPDGDLQLMALLNRSLLLAKDRQWDAAADDLNEILARDAERREAYGDLATLYLEAGRADDAEQALARGLEAGFQSAAHYYSLGARFYSAERHEEAMKAFEIALEIDPTHARAVRSMAAALEKVDRGEEALEQLRRYLELAPQAADAAQIRERLKAAENH